MLVSVRLYNIIIKSYPTYKFYYIILAGQAIQLVTVGMPGRHDDKLDIHLFSLKRFVVNNFKISHLICENAVSLSEFFYPNCN